MKTAVVFLLGFAVVLGGCGKRSGIAYDEASMVYPMDTSQEALVPPMDLTQPNFVFEKLSWEGVRSSNFRWSNFAFNIIDREDFDGLDKATDTATFCPKYATLSRIQKINFWGALTSGIVRYESNYKASTRMLEPQLGYDSVTGRPYASEGLMQLSYSDTKYRGYCNMRWDIDQSKADNDPSKTIFDPYINLECGLKILTNQIEAQGKIVTSTRAYWSVLKPGHSNAKINEIAEITMKLSFCN